MTTDSETTEQYLNFVRTRFFISVPVFVSHDYELQSHTGLIFQFAYAFAIAITFARWRWRSEESTTVSYGANFLNLNLNLNCGQGQVHYPGLSRIQASRNSFAPNQWQLWKGQTL